MYLANSWNNYADTRMHGQTGTLFNIYNTHFMT